MFSVVFVGHYDAITIAGQSLWMSFPTLLQNAFAFFLGAEKTKEVKDVEL